MISSMCPLISTSSSSSRLLVRSCTRAAASRRSCFASAYVFRRFAGPWMASAAVASTGQVVEGATGEAAVVVAAEGLTLVPAPSAALLWQPASLFALGVPLQRRPVLPPRAVAGGRVGAVDSGNTGPAAGVLPLFPSQRLMATSTTSVVSMRPPGVTRRFSAHPRNVAQLSRASPSCSARISNAFTASLMRTASGQRSAACGGTAMSPPAMAAHRATGNGTHNLNGGTLRPRP
mmetsp:Transcript_107647/g.303204  ORF Transcript_107647/g.303204 Transcript_107647/m.303204 type:complete len:233 (+) Transcript_107647:2202-2900(+)